MEKKNVLKLLSLQVVILFFGTQVFGQVDKTAAEQKKLETQFKVAKTNFAKVEKQVSVADSLIETGTKMSEEAETEFDQLNADQKKSDKDYATQSKALLKKVNGKDKEAATQAKTELKELDLKYNTEKKDLANRKKAIEKKTMTGKANLEKGKTSKKALVAPYDKAKQGVDDIESKIAALNGGGDETEKKGKKGKK